MSGDRRRLVLFGAGNMVSDILDAAEAAGLAPSAVVIHHPEALGERDIGLQERLRRWALAHPDAATQPVLIEGLEHFHPQAGEVYLLGPTTPSRAVLAAEVEARFGLAFHVLVHPTAHVSPMAQLAQGVFIGANSTIASGVQLAEHVFVNRGVTIGHDTVVGPFSRVQAGANLGGLSRLGTGVSIGIGATLIERLDIGDGAVVGAGSVVLADVPGGSIAVGVPARVRKPR
jgi:acetyltransferase-like isoleucine patch superfamily enzyme